MTSGVDFGYPSSRTGWRRREKEDESENDGQDGISKMRGYVRSTMDYLLGDFRNYKSLTKSYIDDIYYPVPVPSQAGSLLASNLDVLYSRSIESLPGEDIYIPSYHIDTQPAATKDTPITDMSTTASGPSTSLYTLRSAESVSNPSSSQSVKGSSTVTTSFPGSSHEDSSGVSKTLPIPRGGLVLTSGLASAICASALYSISAWARQRSVTDAATEGLTVGMMAGEITSLWAIQPLPRTSL
ncbi:hypothetical protein FOZ62_028014 [Perkinsus olseni]|uniref:Uncharacterized protein n=1 Tax=Perkinsus olseni TaxID=32597 RepID=A0A7J6PW75_PEROL|nr:hypothetical protein FOZ62_028014 [Perkinsus olseni]